MVNPSPQGIKILSVLPFEDGTHRIRHTGYFLPELKIEDCNVIINEKDLFGQPINNEVKHMKILKHC